MATIIRDDNKIAFIETDCTFEFQGKKFTSGGSFICQRKDNGKYGGIVYADTANNQVTSWNGSIKILARFSPEYRHNMGGKIQHVWFTYQGINFYGKY